MRITVVLCVPSPWSPYIETMASHGTSGLGTTPRVFQSRSAGEDFQLVWPAACTCTRNLCQQGTEILLGGHVCSRASVPSTRAFMHKEQCARPWSLVAKRNTNASHLWLRQCTRIIRCLIYGDIKVTRKEKTRARGHLWSETRSAIHGTSQITNQKPISSRNKRRSQGRPNVKWPARTLSGCAETHRQHEKRVRPD